MKTIYSLVVPGGLLLLAAVILLEGNLLPESWAGFLRLYSYAVLSVGVLLGWRFNRSRLVFALLVLALAERALLYAAAGAGTVVYPAVALLLPLNLAAVSLFTERGLLTARGLLRLGALLAQVLLVGLLSRPALASVAALLDYAFFDPRYFGWTPISQPALLAFAAAFSLLLTRYFVQETALENGFVWSLVAAFLALQVGAGGRAATFYLTTAGLILVVSVIETSYRMAYRDDLTGLPARRALNEAFLKLGSQYVVALVDIDHFKKFNDQYGHQVGDQVLRMVAAKLAAVSGGGKAFRYGGEEFALLFPGRTLAEVLPHLESVRRIIEGSGFALRGRGRPRKKPQKPRASGRPVKKLGVTVSLGAAEPSPRQPTPEQVLKAADKALYRAKNAGRNQVKT